jgi:hypothetical protein
VEFVDCTFKKPEQAINQVVSAPPDGINTTIIILGGGLDPLNVKDAMTKTIQDANGNVIQMLTSYRSNRNFDLLQEEAAKLKP